MSPSAACGPAPPGIGAGDARITDLHVWRIGPGGHADLVGVTSVTIDAETVRRRLATVHEPKHPTVEMG